jgi:hypothetical protein
MGALDANMLQDGRRLSVILTERPDRANGGRGGPQAEQRRIVERREVEMGVVRPVAAGLPEARYLQSPSRLGAAEK